jgi:ABC-type nitrate/sulfonate/bicarbonate transport system substrate-binding protein
MKQWTFRAYGLLVLIAGAFGISGCGPADPGTVTPSSVTEIRVAHRPKALADPTVQVMAEGLVSDPSIRIKQVPVASPGDALAKLRAGEVDVVAGIPLEPVFAQFEGGSVPLRAYLMQVDVPGNPWSAMVGSNKLGVTKLSDLSGKTVATLPTSQAQYLLKRVLAAAGVKNARIVTYNPTTPLLGLRSGEYGAIWALDPARSLAVQEGNTVIGAGLTSELLYQGKPFPLTASMASTAFIEKEPEAYAKYLELVRKAQSYVKANPDKVRQLFKTAAYGGYPDAAIKLFSFPEMRSPDAEIKQVTNLFITELVRDGQLKQRIDIAPLFGQ